MGLTAIHISFLDKIYPDALSIFKLGYLPLIGYALVLEGIF